MISLHYLRSQSDLFCKIFNDLESSLISKPAVTFSRQLHTFFQVSNPKKIITAILVELVVRSFLLPVDFFNATWRTFFWGCHLVLQPRFRNIHSLHPTPLPTPPHPPTPNPRWWGGGEGEGWAIFRNVYLRGTLVELVFWVGSGTLGEGDFF